MISQICLDQDGVLCDFAIPALRLFTDNPKFGASLSDVISRWTPGEYDMCPALKIDLRQFWNAIHERGFEFWSTLEPYPWFRELMDLCKATAPTVICTSPSKHVSSLKGKMCWLQKHLGIGFRDYLMGPPKHFCARPGAVLIDDCDANCEKFIAAGGRAIVFPRLWNSRHAEMNDPMAVVKRELEAMATGVAVYSFGGQEGSMR